jgi:hypothetical protein
VDDTARRSRHARVKIHFVWICCEIRAPAALLGVSRARIEPLIT